MAGPEGWTRRLRYVAISLAALALVLRLGFIATHSDFTPYADAKDFDRIAVSLADHGEYPPSDLARGGGPSAYRPPAYPYLLAAAYKITGTAGSTDRYQVARVLSALLSTASVLLIALIAWWIWDSLAALLALAIAAVYPPLITIGVAMLSEPLFTTSVLAAVACVLAARRSGGRLRWVVLAGLFVGVAALTRTNGVIIAPVIAAGLWSRPRLKWRSLVLPATLIATVVLVLVPWSIRNASAFHHFVPLTTQAGFTLAGTYNDVSRNYEPSPAAWRVPTMAPYDRLFRTSGDEATLEGRFRSQALDYARGHPGYVAEVAYWDSGRLLGLQGPGIEHGAARENGFGNTVSDIDVYAFYLLAILALASILSGALRQTPAFVWVVPLALAVSLVFVNAYMRYRLPMDPFLIVLAGGAAARFAAPALGWAGERVRAGGSSVTPEGTPAVAQAGEVRSVRIESIRAFAALAVLASHAYAVTHGYSTATLSAKVGLGGLLGVVLFFTLTGYLLFWPFVRRDYGDGTPLSLKGYVRNRAVRILPLYYVVLVVLLLTMQNGGTTTQWWRFLTFTQNFSPTTANTVDGPMWSLVVELQFYVALPFIAILLRRLSRGRSAVAAVALVVAAVASLLFCAFTHPPLYIWSWSIATTFSFFAAGMLVALLRVRWQAARPRLVTGWLGRSDVWVALAAVLWCGVIGSSGNWALLVAGTFLLVGAFVLPLEHGLGWKLLAWRPLATVGLASYSLYLWHYPILQRLSVRHSHPHLAVLIAVPLLILLALVSYKLVESPFLRLRQRWSSAAAAQTPAR